MRTRLNKETALFLVGAALAVLVLVKLGLFLADQPESPPAARVPATTLHEGFADLSDDLPVDAIDNYLNSGPRDDPFHDAESDTSVYIRSTVRHRLADPIVESRFRLECVLTPHPLDALRFRLPAGVTVAHVGGAHHDPRRPIRRQGRTLIVPIRPLRHHRADHRCNIEIVLRGPLPTRWSAPVLSCTDAMPEVQSETGALAIDLDRSSPIELIPLTAQPGGLTALTGDAIPSDLVSANTRFTFRFRHPDYTLTLHIQRPRPSDWAGKRKEPPPPKKGETDKGRKKKGKGKGKGPTIPPPEHDIVAAPPGFPLRLMVVYRRDAEGERSQAVLRHKDTGELFRGHEGDTLYDGVRIAAIANDLVTLIDGTGRRFHCPGRFTIQ